MAQIVCIEISCENYVFLTLIANIFLIYSFWDDWIRHPEQRKNRVCIRPEISRTRTFGKVGVSK